MLDCKNCDYYPALSKDDVCGLDLAICDFMDTLFIGDVENLDIEYPCRNTNFDEYLQKTSGNRLSTASVKEFVNPELLLKLKKCGVCMLKFPDGVIGQRLQRQLMKSKLLLNK